MAKVVKTCPICRKRVHPGSKYYPFCSERCQIIDLGNWASEKYVAHSPVTEADEKLASEYGPESDDD